LFHQLPDDVFEEVTQHRNEYAPDIRWALGEPDIPSKFVRIPVGDISDKEWSKTMEEKEMERMRRIKAHKAAFVAPPRPSDELDEQIEETKYTLKKRKDILDEFVALSKKIRKYTSPGMRGAGSDEPIVRDAKMEVAIVENELAGLLTRLELSNKRWTDLAWLDAMQADAAKRPSFLTIAPVPRPSA